MKNSLDYLPDLFLPTTSTPKRSSLDTTSDDSSLVENSVPLKKSKSYHWEVIPAFVGIKYISAYLSSSVLYVLLISH